MAKFCTIFLLDAACLRHYRHDYHGDFPIQAHERTASVPIDPHIKTSRGVEQFSLRGCVALVTGSTTGLGKAIAMAMGAAGTGRNELCQQFRDGRSEHSLSSNPQVTRANYSAQM